MVEIFEKQYATYEVEKILACPAENSNDVVLVMILAKVKDNNISKIFSDTHKTFGTEQEANQWISNTERKLKIMSVMVPYITEMEGYSYYGSNPGIPEDCIEDIAAELLDCL